MNNAAERIRSMIHSFRLSREEILHIAEMAERRAVHPIGSQKRHELTEELQEQIESWMRKNDESCCA